MKYRDSGMPETTYWETLFDVPLILDRLEIDNRIGDAVELGCGHGTFTVPVAQRISGFLRAIDIDASMVARTRERLHEQRIRNARVDERDVVEEGFGIMDASQDACLLFNILHSENPVDLLKQARRILRIGGHAYIIHWRYDPSTPRGPSMTIRPKPEQCLSWAEAAGFKVPSREVVDLPPYHWGVSVTA